MRGADIVQAGEKSPQALELFLVQLRLESPLFLGKERVENSLRLKECAAGAVFERTDDGNFVFFESKKKIVFGKEIVAVPSSGTIEFGHKLGPRFHFDFVHAILHRIERKKSTGAPAS